VPVLNAARLALSGLAPLCIAAAAGTPAPQLTPTPISAVMDNWPDPSFLPERQCRGRYATEDLQRFAPRAKLALWLPGTRSVAVDSVRHCITITVESFGAGRLAELVMRGVAVPRRAVFLRLG
jgi:hypothetical protein